jgi:hypothetical protein
MRVTVRRVRFAVAVAVAVVAGVVALGPSWASASAVTKGIPVVGGAGPLSSDGTHAWVLGGGALSEIDATSGTLVRTIGVPVGSDAVSSDGTHVWVAESGEGLPGGVTEIDAASGAVVKTIPLGFGYYEAVSSDGVHVWIPNLTLGTLTEIDAASGTVVATIQVDTPVPGLSGELAGVSSDGTHVWVQGQWGGLAEIDAATGTVVRWIGTPAAADDYSSVVSSDGTHVWVASAPAGATSEADELTEVDAATGRVLRTISGPEDSASNDNWTAVSSDGTDAWAVDAGAGTVTEIDAASGRVIKTIRVGKNPGSVSSDGAHVWVANDAGVAEVQISPRAHPIVGIGDDKPDLFKDPRFLALGVESVRYDMAWDALSDGRQRARVTRWMDAAKADGLSVLVTLDHSDRVIIKRVHGKERRISQARVVPSVAAYVKAFRTFRKRFPWVTQFATWDETNFYGEPTYDKETLVAGYYRALRSACPECTIIAAELLDTPKGDAVAMTTWAHGFIKALGRQPGYWGLDNFEDANHLTTSNTRKLLAAVRGNIWLDETGGIVARHDGAEHAGFPENAPHAAKADRYLLDTIGSLSPRIQRIYLYEWDANTSHDSWDSALISPDGKLRPGYDVLAQALNSWGTKPDCSISSAPPTCA